MTPETRYERLVRQTQADARIPVLSVALHRADRPLWTLQIGDGGTQFRIGSVTKTFTAVLVLQCRDEGLLDLDDPLGKHLDLAAHGELPIRRLLSHTAGIQREPYGDVWDTLDAPDVTRLLADLARAERVLPQARRYHYSNLGLALLGYLVGKLRKTSWETALHERILDPLGLADTTVAPTDRAATGAARTCKTPPRSRSARSFPGTSRSSSRRRRRCAPRLRRFTSSRSAAPRSAPG